MKKSVISLRVLVAVMSLSVVSGVFAQNIISQKKADPETQKSSHKKNSAAKKSKEILVGKDLVVHHKGKSVVLKKKGRTILTGSKMADGTVNLQISKDPDAAEAALKIIGIDFSNPQIQKDWTELKKSKTKDDVLRLEEEVSPELVDTAFPQFILAILNIGDPEGTDSFQGKNLSESSGEKLLIRKIISGDKMSLDGGNDFSPQDEFDDLGPETEMIKPETEMIKN